jgi:hypothetical protein
MSKLEVNKLDNISGSSTLTIGETNTTAVEIEATAEVKGSTLKAATDSDIGFEFAGGSGQADIKTIGANTNGQINLKPKGDGNVLVYSDTGTDEYARFDGASECLTVGSGTLSSNQDGIINVIGASGTNTEYYILQETQVEGHIGFTANNNQRLYINTGPTLGSTGVYMANGGTSWTSNSDERAKTIIENITGGLNKVDSLRAVIGRYTNTDASDKRRPFLIAQDVQSVLPEAVDSSDSTDLGLDYAGVIPLLVSALKDAKAQIDDLKTRIQTLENA